MNTQSDQTTVVNDLVAIAQGKRKDCVVVASPNRAAIINNANPVTSAVTTANTFTNSSYLIVDNNYLKVYDKFTDQYIFIPASSSTAGIMAATDYVAAPWFSPVLDQDVDSIWVLLHWHIHLRKQKEIPYTKLASIRLPTFQETRCSTLW